MQLELVYYAEAPGLQGSLRNMPAIFGEGIDTLLTVVLLVVLMLHQGMTEREKILTFQNSSMITSFPPWLLNIQPQPSLLWSQRPVSTTNISPTSSTRTYIQLHQVERTLKEYSDSNSHYALTTYAFPDQSAAPTSQTDEALPPHRHQSRQLQHSPSQYRKQEKQKGNMAVK